MRHAYVQHGREQFINELRGTFALAVIDERDQSATFAIDRMGIERMAYALADETLAFSESAEAIANLPWVTRSISEQAVYDYLLLHMVPAPRTIYAAVRKLPPATIALYRDGTLSTRRYWIPEFATRDHPSQSVLRERLHEGLDRATRRCAPDARTGAFLSGGLDSSTVAGVLRNIMGSPIDTFSVGFGDNRYDELRYARIANGHFSCRGHEFQATSDDVVRIFPKIAEAYDEPFGNSSAAPTYLCAEVALRHGVHHLLAGDGGDELFAGNERYAKQLVLESYSRAPRWLRRGVMDPLADATSDESRILPLRKFRSFVRQARTPLPRRLESWNFLTRTPSDSMFHPDFLAAADPEATFGLMQQVWEELPSDSPLDRMLYYDWHFTLASNDLRKVGTMCEIAGVRVSYPMLDDDVIDLALQVPAGMRMRGLELRSFYKKAMKGFLPEETLAKGKHGFGLPFSIWLREHRGLADLISAHLADLKRRRIVRNEFIDDLSRRHAADPSSYLAYPIWSLAMLSAWLDAHEGKSPPELRVLRRS